MTALASGAAIGGETERSVTRSAGLLCRPLTQTRTNVLHLIAPAAAGGAESVVRLLASRQKALGARVTVAAIVDAETSATEFVAALRNASVDVHRICVAGRDYRRERRLVLALCQDASPDALHSHGYRTDLVDALSLRHQFPIVSTVHGFTGGDLRNRFYQWLQRAAYSRFDAVVAVSEPLERRLRGQVDAERLHVARNAYAAEENVLTRAEARAVLGMPNDAFVVGWVGRLSHEKGPDLLLEALANQACPSSVHAVILGEGPLGESLRARASRLRLDGRVAWKGRMASASRLFSAFDVLVLSSRTEGTPMVVLEAMAVETPIVATRVGGIPDMLPPGTGRLVRSESVEGLASAIREVFMDREAAKAQAFAARQRLDAEYGVAAWVDCYENIYLSARRLAERRLRG